MNRVLIINGYYLPSQNYGGPLTSIVNVINSCYDFFEFYVVCHNHDFNSNKPFDVQTNQWISVGNAKVMYLDNNSIDFSIKRMRELLYSVRPDMLWFTGVLTPRKKIVAAVIANQSHIPILISPRGELDHDRVVIKGAKKIPYLHLLRISRVYSNCFFHATSDDERSGIVKYFNPGDNHIFYAPNVSISKQPVSVSHFKKANQLSVLFYSRIHPVKNLLFAIQILALCKQTILFDIYGPIEDQEYWSACKLSAKQVGSNISIQYKGILKKSELPRVIQEHDCLLFPTINENYGHVIAETLANSRPVIISKGTTPWDDLNDRAGFSIELNNPVQFAKCLDQLAIMDNDSFRGVIESTSLYFDNCALIRDAIDDHIRMFNTVIQSSKKSY